MKNFWKSHFSSLISKPQKPEFYFVVSSLVEAQRMVADYGGRRLGVAIPTFISSVQYNAIVDLLGRFAINLTLLNPRNNPSVSVTILDAMSDENVKDYRNLTGASVVIVAISSAAGTGMASKIAAKTLERGFVVAQRLHGKRMHAAEAAVDVRAANIPPPVPEPTWNLQGVLSGIFTFGSAFFIFKMVAKIIQDVSRTPASTPSSSSKDSYALQEFSMIYLLAILLCKIR